MPRRSPPLARSTSFGIAVVVVSFSLALAPAPGVKPAPARPAPNRPAPAKAQGPKSPAADVNVAGLPTADELHQSFKDGNYKETLQKLSRVLALKGDAAKAYDRHDLL